MPPSRPAPPNPARAVPAPADASDAPPVRIAPPVKDFGYVLPKSVNRFTFQIWNDGEKPVEIAAVQPGCKCTTVNDLVGTTIEPGKYVELEAQLDAAIATGPKGSDIKILIDGYGTALECRMRAEVSLPVRIVPGYINAVRGGPEQGILNVESTDRQPFRICSVGGMAPEIQDFDPATDSPRAKYLLRYDLTKFPAGQIPRYLVIETDHPDCPVADVLVRHDSVRFPPGIRGTRDLKVGAGLIETGTSIEFDIEFNLGREPLTISGARSPNENLKLELVDTHVEDGLAKPAQEGGTEPTKRLIARVRATPREGFGGVIVTPIYIQASDGREQEIFFHAKVGPKGVGCGGT